MKKSELKNLIKECIAESSEEKSSLDTVRDRLKQLTDKRFVILCNLRAWLVVTPEGQKYLQKMIDTGQAESDIKTQFIDMMKREIHAFDITADKLNEYFTKEFGIRDGVQKMFNIK